MHAFFLRILAATLLIVTASSTQADTAAKDAFRQLVISGNYTAVEAQIARMDQEVIANGYADNSRLRHLFTVFQTTHPEVRDTIFSWGKAMPDSLFQQVALGWHLQHIASIARGNFYIRYTHPKALERQRELHRQISDIVKPAFRARQDFVPLNDLIVVLLRNHGDTAAVLEFAAQAMPANPSYGLLVRLREAALPIWGGSWEAVETLCNDWAEKVTFHEGYDAEICVAQTFSRQELRDGRKDPEFSNYFNDLLQRTPPPMLDAQRVVFWENEPERYSEWKAAVIRDFNPYSHIAQRSAYFYAAQKGIPELLETHQETMQAADAARQPNDPYNPGLIEPQLDLMRGDHLGGTRSPDRLATIRKQIYGALPYGRYGPEIWLNAAGYLRDYSAPALRFEEELPNFKKAVIASGYNPQVLSLMYNALTEQLAWSYMDEQGHVPILVADPENAQGRMTDQDRAKLAEIAEARDWMVCPYVQSRYLLLQACGGDFSNRPFCGKNIQENPNTYIGKRLLTTHCPIYEVKKLFSPGFNEDLEEDPILPDPVALPRG